MKRHIFLKRNCNLMLQSLLKVTTTLFILYLKLYLNMFGLKKYQIGIF
jgi:hypothetical protein